MRLMSFILALSLVPSVAFTPLVEARPRELHSEFKIPATRKLREKVDFWIQIYSKYESKEGLIHDARYPTVIYEVIDFSKSSRSRFQQTRIAKERIRDVLMSIHRSGAERDAAKYATLSPEERRVYDLFRNVTEPNKFLNAAHFKRLRMQAGQKNHFLSGMKEAGRYLPFMEKVIIDQGVPFEISRLPYVESSFNTRARSKVGASGIWQFMRSTGADFLEINDAIDERNDPIRATEAAAKLLKANYASLPAWPLAVTAYNHGRISLMRAVRRYGTQSLERLFEVNKIRGFGFASSNFFACLLAAIEIDRHPEKYFGPVDRERPHRFVEVKLPEAIRLKDLIRFMGLPRAEVVDLNPAFQDEVLKSELSIPAGYRLRIPHSGTGTDKAQDSQRRVFLAGFRKIPKTYKKSVVAKEGKRRKPRRKQANSN